MPAYIIALRETPLRDAESDREYSRQTQAMAAAFQARFGLRPLAVNGRSETVEGAGAEAVVLLEFPDYDRAKAWYESADYQSLIPLREKAGDWRVVIVEGLQPG